MKKVGVVTLVLIVGAPFIAALPIVGADAGAKSVLPADCMPIAQPQDSGQWKGNELTVEYSYSKDQGHMDLSGNIRFSNSLVMGLSRLEDFRLSAIFLDENGKVLEKEIGLATNRGPLDPIPFKRKINLPANAAFMAFSYQGTGIENIKSGGSHSSFSFYPIH